MPKDPFTSPGKPGGQRYRNPATAEGRADVERNHHGQYLLPNEAGEIVAHVRVSTFAETVARDAELVEYQHRTLAKGISISPDLIALGSAIPSVDFDKDRWRELVSTGQDRGGSNYRSNLGTAMHFITERWNRGERGFDVPEYLKLHLEQYLALLHAAGITILPEMLERVLVQRGFQLGGCLDNAVRWDGKMIIGDLKTGKDMKYGRLAKLVQLWAYSELDQLWDTSAKEYEPRPPELVRGEALIISVPLDGTAELFVLDLSDVEQLATLTDGIREWRKIADKRFQSVSKLAKPKDVVIIDMTIPPAAAPDWLVQSITPVAVSVDVQPGAQPMTGVIACGPEQPSAADWAVVENFAATLRRTKAQARADGWFQTAELSSQTDFTLAPPQADPWTAPAPAELDDYTAGQSQFGEQTFPGQVTPQMVADAKLADERQAKAAAVLTKPKRLPGEPESDMLSEPAPALTIDPATKPKRTCSVCHQPGHRKGSDKCPGTDRPSGEQTIDITEQQLDSVNTESLPPAGWVQDAEGRWSAPLTDEPVTINSEVPIVGTCVPGTHDEGWRLNQDANLWVCGGCGQPSPAAHGLPAGALTEMGEPPYSPVNVLLNMINAAPTRAQLNMIRQNGIDLGTWNDANHLEPAKTRLAWLRERGQ